MFGLTGSAPEGLTTSQQKAETEVPIITYLGFRLADMFLLKEELTV